MSVRFHDPRVAERLKEEAAAGASSASALAEELIDEGLRSRRHPMIAFRAGPSGRRSCVIGAADVWEIVGAVVGGDVAPSRRLARAADQLGLRPEQVDAAMAYYAEFTDEVDGLIEANRRAADEAEQLWRRRQELLAG